MQEKFRKTKKKRVKRRTEENSGVAYFTIDTERAILNFLESSDDRNRNFIYQESIKPALSKLVENVIFVYKFNTLDNLDVLKNDCVSFLFEVLHKFDPSRNKKAFSYFNQVAKNWFIQKVKAKQNPRFKTIMFDKNVLNYLEKTNNERVVFSSEDEYHKLEFMEILKDEMVKWRNKFEKPQEKNVLEAVILLLNNPDFISTYNRKEIFIHLKEITGLNAKQIATNLKKMKRKYSRIKNIYDNGDY